ncbi:hypothetical protein, partial [Vibrio campbellii]|uniref:hypothetical protein n=1 Tax=Vibrio campbellii TaxID=680 RepID=UPI00142E1595
WDGNTDPGDGSDLATELERLRYMDVLTLQGGSMPALDGDVLQAVLAGSVPERDLTPPNATYEWYRDEATIAGEVNNRYTVAGADRGTTLQAKVLWNDSLGNGEIASDERLVSTNSTTLSWSVSLNPMGTPLPVGQSLSAVHRDLQSSESVTYQWYRLSSAVDWANKQPINGAVSPDYRVSSADVDAWLGVEATLDLTGEQFTARVVSDTAVTESTSGNDLSLMARITPTVLYTDSTLGYSVTLDRDGEVETQAALLNNVDVTLTAQWYAIDDLSALNQPSSSWASITNTSDLTSHV